MLANLTGNCRDRRTGGAALLALWLGLAASPAAAQAPGPRSAPDGAAGPGEPAPAIRLPAAGLQQAGPTRRVTVSEAVTLGFEQNLDLQVERINPLIQDLNIVEARSVYTPELSTTLFRNSRDSPSQTIFEGGEFKVTDSLVQDSVDLVQEVPFMGGRYTANWDGSQSSTTNIFSSFDPTLRSNLRLSYQQPLLRNFRIDGPRQQIAISRANRDLSDIQLRNTVVLTARNVEIAYWNLVYALSSLEVQQQSLDLALESLANNRRRVEVGTLAAIDIVEAQSEVARNEEAVIVAEATMARAEDQLRTLILDPDDPDYWETALVPTDAPELQPREIDVDAAVRNALDARTDLAAIDKNLEATDINIQYFENQRLPDVDLNVNYNLSGLGGTRFIRTGGFPGTVVGQEDTSFGSVLGDIVANEFPNWTVGVTVSYPFGTSQADAGLERARLQRSQAEVSRRSTEVRVAAQVRDAARNLRSNLQRVEATRAARELAEERLSAEQRRFEVGLVTTFFVFQAQRDLAAARNNEQRAILDYTQSLVNFDAVQEIPLGGAF